MKDHRAQPFSLDISLLTFQMLSPFPVSLYTILPTPSMKVFPHSSPFLVDPPSCLPALVFPDTGVLSLGMAKGFSSYWCSIRPSSATYAAGAMGLSMVWSLGDRTQS